MVVASKKGSRMIRNGVLTSFPLLEWGRRDKIGRKMMIKCNQTRK